MVSTDINYDDVQGTILRGYRVDFARHFILGIVDAKATGNLLQNLIQGANGLPQVTTAQRGNEKPDLFLNVSFTCTGLALMGVADSDLKTFDSSFQSGAASETVATTVGDINESAPSHWIGGLGNNDNVHLLVSLWVRNSQTVLNDTTTALMAAFNGAVTVLLVQDGNALPDNKVHFGYRDSIAQPTVIGAPPGKYPPDDQPEVPTGEFLLGYTNAIGGIYSVSPAQLSKNSSYAAFRILQQDEQAFNSLLGDFATKTGLDSEMVAAKICGRWRNGNPLILSPDQQEPALPSDQLNNFNYVTESPETDDTLGLTCPIGSHIRRNNPRDGAVVGTDSMHHRIIRRAMPYGKIYDPQKPDKDRGLVGYFINASITNQFEFLTSQWNLADEFVKSAVAPGGGPAGNAVFNISGQDVFLGVNTPAPSSSFTFARAGKNGSNNINATGFGRIVTTLAGIYCFFPSITGLNYLVDISTSST